MKKTTRRTVEQTRATEIATALGRAATSPIEPFNRANYVAACTAEGIDPRVIEFPQYAFHYGRDTTCAALESESDD